MINKYEPSQKQRVKCDEEKQIKMAHRKVDYDGDAVEFCKL